MRIVLVTGGTRGGKSRYAEERGRALGGNGVTYVATAIAGDEEMRDRIARHRRDRPAEWETIEAPSVAGDAIRAACNEVVVLDCLTTLTANALGGETPRDEGAAIARMIAAVEDVLTAAAERRGTLVVVTNEVGFGVHPPTALGRWFENGLGRANQLVAAAADEVILMVAGIPLAVKGGE